MQQYPATTAAPPVWISGTTQYALRAVLFVAEHGSEEPVRVDAIAAALNETGPVSGMS